MTEASTIRLPDSDPLEETCLGVGVGDHREAGDCREATSLL